MLQEECCLRQAEDHMEVRAEQGLKGKRGISERSIYVHVESTSEGPSKHASSEPSANIATRLAAHLNAKSMPGLDFIELTVAKH